MKTVQQRERRVRELLAKEGERLWKVRVGRRFWEYGPYAVIDANTNFMLANGMTLESVEDSLSRSEENGHE